MISDIAKKYEEINNKKALEKEAKKLAKQLIPEVIKHVYVHKVMDGVIMDGINYPSGQKKSPSATL